MAAPLYAVFCALFGGFAFISSVSSESFALKDLQDKGYGMQPKALYYFPSHGKEVFFGQREYPLSKQK